MVDDKPVRRPFPEQLAHIQEELVAAQAAVAQMDAWTPLDLCERRLARRAALLFLFEHAEQAQTRAETQRLNARYDAQRAAEAQRSQALRLRQELQAKRARIAAIDQLLAQDMPPLPDDLKQQVLHAAQGNPFIVQWAYDEFKRRLGAERAQFERESTALETEIAKAERAGTDDGR
jgi:hypothetical protein